MSDVIKLNETVAARRRVPIVLLNTDGSPATGITISAGDLKITKNGATEGNHGGTLTEQAAGDYYYELSTGEVDTWGFVRGRLTKTGLQVSRFEVQIRDFVDQAIAVWDRVISAQNHNIQNSAGRILRTAGGGTQVTIRSSTTQAGSTANTIKLDSGASSVDDIYNRNLVVITSGPAAGQTRRIVDYVGATKVATLDKTWVTIPGTNVGFDIIAAPVSIVSDEGVAQAGAAGTITLATTASTSDDIYNSALVTITAGTGAGQTRQITDYVGSTRVASVDQNWSVNPDVTSVYAVIPAGEQTSGDTGGGVSVPSVGEIASEIFATIIDGDKTMAMLLKALLSANAGKTVRTSTSPLTYQYLDQDGNLLFTVVYSANRERTTVTFA